MEAGNGSANTERPTSNAELTAATNGFHREVHEGREERQRIILTTANGFAMKNDRTETAPSTGLRAGNSTTRQLSNLATMLPRARKYIAWEVTWRLLGHCLDIAKQPNGKSVASQLEIMGCDRKARRGTLLSNIFFSQAVSGCVRTDGANAACGTSPMRATARPAPCGRDVSQSRMVKEKHA